MARITKTTTPLDRLLDALRDIVRSQMVQVPYLGVYDYVITATDGTTVDVTPGEDTEIPVGDLKSVPVRTGVDGIKVTISPTAAGNHCLIMFVNGDPSRPACVSIDHYELPAPSVVTGAIARVGDQVIAGPFGGNVITGSGSVSKS